MTEFVIRLIAPEGGSALASEPRSQIVDFAMAAVNDQVHKMEYLRRGDVEAFDGRGDVLFTKHVEQAKRFPTWEAAFEFWRAQSKTRPLREDGKPNRPLTAFSITIDKV